MRNQGFTLIELLVVISIISLLSTVVLAGVSSARVKARDARRAAEMQSIYVALQSFYNQYDCLPITYGTSCTGASGYLDTNAGGWDYSSQGGFLSFLVSSGITSVVPVDPVNNMTGDATAGQFAYRYYCYPSGANPGLHLGYWKESTGTYVNKASASSFTDTTILCK